VSEAGPGEAAPAVAAPGGASSGQRCRRCDGTNLRRSHSRHGLQKLIRRHTGLDRYACRSCGHRGWTWGTVPSRSELDAAALAAAGPGGRTGTPSGRRMERRDLRLTRRLRVRSWVAVVASLGLGILAAVYLQRCGVPPPPVE
jgi:hypothetical protein